MTIVSIFLVTLFANEGLNVVGSKARRGMECRYCTYLESHPAYMPVSDEIVIEATVDSLSWSYSGSYLASLVNLHNSHRASCR